MKYRIELEVTHPNQIEHLHQFLAKTHNFNKKFFTWVLTREKLKTPIVRIKAIAISRDLDAELFWGIACTHTNPEEKIYEPYEHARDWIIPESKTELNALYPRKNFDDTPWMNVFELNDFLEVSDIYRN